MHVHSVANVAVDRSDELIAAQEWHFPLFLAHGVTGVRAMNDGTGDLALVFLAQDLRHDRKVALKVLRPDLSAAIGAERFPPRDQARCRSHPPAHPSGLRFR